MNKDTRGTIEFCENRLKGKLLYLWELYIYGKTQSKIGSWCLSVNHFHIVWSIFTSVQIFSLIHCYLSTAPEPILSWAYFKTPAIFFNRSGSVAVLWLAATLAGINKRKWSLKKEKIKKSLNAIAEEFSLNKIFYIQGFPTLCHSFLQGLNSPPPFSERALPLRFLSTPLFLKQI